MCVCFRSACMYAALKRARPADEVLVRATARACIDSLIFVWGSRWFVLPSGREGAFSSVISALDTVSHPSFSRTPHPPSRPLPAAAAIPPPRRPRPKHFFLSAHAFAKGLTVYCAVSVANINYPCSLATFSPPGDGMAVVPPIFAPLRLVESPGPSGGISLGCHLEEDAGDSSGAGGGAGSERAGKGGWRRWMRRLRARPAGAIGRESSGAGSYAGSVLLVSRGECTFEQKVRVARRWHPSPMPVAVLASICCGTHKRASRVGAGVVV